ncbi:MAG: hypothetical protein IIA70_08705, partial [Proteobacteria bacterium]|nr:hypothetical protein [Pseudomonadota bacterium]
MSDDRKLTLSDKPGPVGGKPPEPGKPRPGLPPRRTKPVVVERKRRRILKRGGEAPAGPAVVEENFSLKPKKPAEERSPEGDEKLTSKERDARVEALKESMRLYNSVGTTGTYEGHGVAPEVLRAYKELWDRGEMTVRSRLVLSPSWGSVAEAEREMERMGPWASGAGFGDGMLRISGYY